MVTPVGWVYPDLEKCTAMLEAACAEGGSTLHGTGIHPGGITERFPLMVSALSAAVTHVRAEEFSDIRTYGAPDVVRHIMGFGGTPEEAMAEPDGEAARRRASRRRCGWSSPSSASTPIPSSQTMQEIAVATAPIDTPIGVDRARSGRGARFRWRGAGGRRAGRHRRVNWLMGEEHLDPAWSFGPEGERFEVEVTGDPTCG